jgi:cysteine-rich repeat protein
MASRSLVGSGVKWSAGVALLLGCGATDGMDPTTQTTDDAFGRRVVHHPSPAPHGPGRGPGHGHGRGPGHGHGGPGAAGGPSGRGGSSGSFSSGGQSSGSGAASNVGGTGNGSAGSGTAGFAGGFDPGVCGDGQQSGYEQCDDGNALDGDGCDADCMVEPGFTCSYYEPCRPVACGDGLQDSYPSGDGNWEYEQCDDGNTTSGDGCSSTCDPEPGFMCFNPGEACKDVVCGDGEQDSYYVLIEGGGGTGGTGFGGMAGSGPTGPYIGWAYEGCDDGNTASGDGCNATCETESGWVCDPPGQPCRQPRCGDGYMDFIPGAGGTSGSGGMASAGAGGYYSGTYEQCDDRNVTSGDGCSSSCTLEPGYSCPSGGEPCKLAVCGDGIVDYPVESCDDGNTVNGDYCTSGCEYDYGGYGGYSGSGYGGAGGGVTAGTGGILVGGSPGTPTGPAGGRSSRGG